MKKTLTLIYIASLILAQHASAQDSRMIAQSSYNHDGSNFAIADTISFTYLSWMRGGDLKSRYIAYDDATTYSYDFTSSSLIRSRKIMQKFNAANQRTVAITAIWNKSIGAWEDATTAYYYQTADDSITSLVNQSWNKSAVAWDNTSQQKYTYDAAKNRTSYTLEFWNTGSSKWEGYEQFLYEYDASNNLTKKTYQIWNTATSAWDNIFKDSITYSSSKKVLLTTNILWNTASSSWRNNKKMEYTFDASDYLVNQKESGWDGSGWYNVQQIKLTNDSKGNTIQRVTENWNTGTAAWENFRQQFASYDANNNLLNYYNQKWDAPTSAFINSDQRHYTYDANNNMLTDVSSLWNNTTVIWDSSIKLTYTYNIHNQKSSQNYENWSVADGVWKHNIGDQLFYYYYQDFSTAISEQTAAKGQLQLYPIPAQNELNIKLKWNTTQAFSARITDISGRIYRQWDANAANEYAQAVSLQGLSSGTYFIEFAGHKEGHLKQAFTVTR